MVGLGEFTELIAEVKALAHVGLGPKTSVAVTGAALVTVAGQSELGMESFSLVVIGQARGFSLFISDTQFHVTEFAVEPPRITEIAKPLKRPRIRPREGSRAWLLDD